jgi:hypothetical protein
LPIHFKIYKEENVEKIETALSNGCFELLLLSPLQPPIGLVSNFHNNLSPRKGFITPTFFLWPLLGPWQPWTVLMTLKVSRYFSTFQQLGHGFHHFPLQW